jgi:hypothetical protein
LSKRTQSITISLTVIIILTLYGVRIATGAKLSPLLLVPVLVVLVPGVLVVMIILSYAWRILCSLLSRDKVKQQ